MIRNFIWLSAVSVACCWAQQPAPAAALSWPLQPLVDIAREVPALQDQTPPASTTAPASTEPIPQAEPYYLELGGFDNFVNNNYGQWRGAQGRVMFRHLRGKGIRHFTPIVSFATQTRPGGSQATFGLDSYIVFNKWFYMLGGFGGSPSGSAVLWPKWRYGATGFITVPGVKGLVATLGASQIRGNQGDYGNIFSAGYLYYYGKAIWSGYLNFNRNYPGSIASNSGGFAVQYGAEKKQWIGIGMSGGKIAYQTIELHPLDVRFNTFGPNLFYQKWITPKWGVILRYDYQNELNAYERHGVSASVFFEFGPIPPEIKTPAQSTMPLPLQH